MFQTKCNVGGVGVLATVKASILYIVLTKIIDIIIWGIGNASKIV